MCLKVLYKSGESAFGVLSSPSKQFLGVWAGVAKPVLTAESFNEDVRDVSLDAKVSNLVLGFCLGVEGG